ncbi:MAG: polysaccharide pyruvyl transferase family protein [Deltaproteobacteria bacterium]|nr:polysaccharide pyruvyl transferase family protein [Deltaproteobacteria bacterium]
MDISSLKDNPYQQFSSLRFAEKTCALAIYPKHWNISDVAIWLGTLKFLRSLGLIINYQCDHRTYNPKALARRIQKGPIFITGGGNFGDVYHNEIRLRQQIMKDFPDRQIIQCSQSIWFKEEANISRIQTFIGK